MIKKENLTKLQRLLICLANKDLGWIMNPHVESFYINGDSLNLRGSGIARSITSLSDKGLVTMEPSLGKYAFRLTDEGIKHWTEKLKCSEYKNYICNY